MTVPINPLNKTLRDCLLAFIVCLVLTTSLVCAGCDRSDEASPGTGDPCGISEDVRHLLPVCDGKKWGYVDRRGGVAIRCKYDRAWRFHDGMGVISIDGMKGIVDNTEGYLIEPIYESLLPFKGQAYAYKRDGVWGILDVKMNQERPLRNVSEIGASNGHILAPARLKATGSTAKDSSGLWGYVNTDGDIVIRARFDEASWFEGECARVRVGKKWGLISSDGQYILEPRLDFINYIEPWPRVRWRKRCYRVRNNGRYGYLHPDGQWLIRPMFRKASEFGEQWAAACDSEGVWGFIDATGCMRLRMADTEVQEGSPTNGFWRGLAGVETADGNTTWIDPEGRIEISPRAVYKAWKFWPDGLAVIWVSKVSKTVVSAVMDTKGHYVFGPRECMVVPIPLAGGFRRVTIPAGKMSILTYLNREGRIIWLPKGHPWATSDQRW